MFDHSAPTSRQNDVLRVIREALAASGYPPTRAEIAAALGMRSANAAQEHLRALERKGLLHLDGSHRGIRLAATAMAARAAGRQGEGDLRSHTPVLRLPLVGRVAAGTPILANSHVESEVTLDPALFHPRPDYLLRVRGASMRDAGMLDGDLVAVHATREARSGQIVVVRLGEEATVKTLQRRGNQVLLLPANADFAPIAVDPAQQPLAIEGLVVGVLRQNPTGARR